MKKILLILIMVVGLFADKVVHKIVDVRYTIYKDNTMTMVTSGDKKDMLYISMKQYEIFVATIALAEKIKKEKIVKTQKKSLKGRNPEVAYKKVSAVYTIMEDGSINPQLSKNMTRFDMITIGIWFDSIMPDLLGHKK